MGITKDRGRWYFVKRVPKRFAHLDPRSQVRECLFTDSEAEARRKAPGIEARFLAYWEALAAGEAGDAAAQYAAARRLAEARGLAYLPADQGAERAALREALARLEAVVGASGQFLPATEVAAVLGGVAVPELRLSDLAEEFFSLTEDRRDGKGAGQVHRWMLPRRRALKVAVEVIGDKPLASIAREDALAYRAHWDRRAAAGEVTRDTANKNIGYLRQMFRIVAELRGLDLACPFERLAFRTVERRARFPFSPGWIRDRLLAPGALGGMGEEARAILLMMVNTGARPSEISGAAAEDFAVEAEIPHFVVRAHPWRTLKTAHSAREIPLLGVSLAAGRDLAAAGGPQRYRGKGNAWSAAVNKFLTENGLRESPDHTAYSLRHSFEDRLLEAGVDERLRVELMGHKYKRPAYGQGGTLELKRAAVARAAL